MCPLFSDTHFALLLHVHVFNKHVHLYYYIAHLTTLPGLFLHIETSDTMHTLSTGQHTFTASAHNIPHIPTPPPPSHKHYVQYHIQYTHILIQAHLRPCTHTHTHTHIPRACAKMRLSMSRVLTILEDMGVLTSWILSWHISHTLTGSLHTHGLNDYSTCQCMYVQYS